MNLLKRKRKLKKKIEKLKRFRTWTNAAIKEAKSDLEYLEITNE